MQTTGDGINDELRIYTGETSLFLAGPRFGGMDSTLASGALGCCFIRERSVDTILWYSESLIPLQVWICQGAEHW